MTAPAPPPPPLPPPPEVGARRQPPRARSRLSVRWRITLVATAVVAVALALAGVVVVRSVRTVLLERVRESDRVAAEVVAEALSRGIDPNQAVVAVSRQRLLLVQVIAVDGSVVAATPVLRGAGSLLTEGDDPRVQVRELFDLSGGDWITTQVPAVVPGVGNVTVAAFSPSTDVQRAAAALAQVLLVAVPLLVLGVGGLVWVLVGRALRPVEAIRSEVDEISGTSLDRRVPEAPGDDEIARLARTMNGMLDRLERAAQRQQRFVADASHELRSPLATVRAELEVALREGERADWPAVATDALRDTARMELLVVNLLELARLEEGAPAPPATEVDLDELVLDEVARVHSGVEIDTSRVSGGRVHGDREQLRRVVRNLLDNALRHARRRVAVAVRSAGPPLVVLEVLDDGPGVPPSERERIFERFARLQAGRERGSGGYGLGLALTKQIVERHGGTVEVDDAPEGGACFVVTLPAA